MKTVWQRIPSRRARNSKTPTTITVQSIPRNDQLPLTGGPQVLTTDDVGCLCTTVHQVQRSCSMNTSIYIRLSRWKLGPDKTPWSWTDYESVNRVGMPPTWIPSDDPTLHYIASCVLLDADFLRSLIIQYSFPPQTCSIQPSLCNFNFTVFASLVLSPNDTVLRNVVYSV